MCWWLWGCEKAGVREDYSGFVGGRCVVFNGGVFCGWG